MPVVNVSIKRIPEILLRIPVRKLQVLEFPCVGTRRRAAPRIDNIEAKQERGDK